MDRRHQGQVRTGVGLGVADSHGLCAPVDVLDQQVPDFARPQPVGCQKLQDRIIAQAHRRGVALCGLQHRGDLAAVQCRGHTLIGIKQGRNDARRQIRRDASCPEQVAQQRAKPFSDVFERFAPQAMRSFFHVKIDVADIQRLDAGSAAALDLPAKKVPSLPHQRDNTRGGQSALVAQPGLVFAADLVPQCRARSDHHWWRRPLTLNKPQQCMDSGTRNR
jgi:hypothetical protein